MRCSLLDEALHPLGPLRFLYRYVDLVVIFAVILLIFHEILMGYVGYLDFSTLPSFVPVYPVLSLSGVSLSPGVFSVNLNPGLTLILSILTAVGSYGSNVFYFLYLLFFAFGIRALASSFTRDKTLIVTATLVGVLNPGTLTVIIDSPTTLYVAPISWFLAYYYRYRIQGEGKLIYSILPLTVLGLYGPPIPSLILSLLAVEIWRFHVKGLRISDFVSPLLVLGAFSLIHANAVYLVLTGGAEYKTLAHTATFTLTRSPSFNLVQILGTLIGISVTQLHNYFSSVEIASLTLVTLTGFGALYLALKKKVYFPMIFGLLLFAVSSYQQNYLGVFSLIHDTVFGGIDPYEYNPMVGFLLAMVIANLSKDLISRTLTVVALVA